MREGLNMEKYLEKEDVSLPQKKEAEKPAKKFEVIEGGKKDWPKLYQEKQEQASGLFRQLKDKYKRGKWDKEDPLYQEWLLVTRQVQQIAKLQEKQADVQAAKAELAESEKLARAKMAEAAQIKQIDLEITGLRQKFTKSESDVEALPKKEEKAKEDYVEMAEKAISKHEGEAKELKEKIEIAQELESTLARSFAEAEEETKKIEEKIQTPPEITAEIVRRSYLEDSEKEDLELTKNVQEMAKKLVKVEDRLKKAEENVTAAKSKRRNIFSRGLQMIVRGGKGAGEPEFEKAKKEYEQAQKDYKETAMEYDKVLTEAKERGIFSGQSSLKIRQTMEKKKEQFRKLSNPPWVRKF